MRNKISIVFLAAAFGSALLAPVDSFSVPPTASEVFISGKPQVGQVLTGNYAYDDAEGDLEGASTFRWGHGLSCPRQHLLLGGPHRRGHGPDLHPGGGG